MKWTDYIPFVGLRILDEELVEDAGLDTGWAWRGIHMEWMRQGIILLAWAVRPVK